MTDKLKSILKPINIAVGLIIALAIALRAFHIGDSIGGYHGFNEAFYSMNAKYYLTHSILGLFTNPIDINNPPLINMLLWISFKLFGYGELSARLVTSLFSVLSVIYVFKLGKLMYNERVGAAAAAFLAVSPGFLLAGRNIQTDSTFIFFMLAGTYYYMRSTKGDGRNFKLIAAVIFALGMLTKLFTVIALVALLIWEINRYRGVRFLIGKDHLLFLGTFLFLSVPWFLWQTLNKNLIEGQSGLASAAFQPPNIGFFLNSFIPEVMWGLSPLLFVLLPVGIYYLIKERKDADILVGLLLAAFLMFYLYFHFHSYYLLPTIPLAFLAISRMLDRLIPNKIAFSASVVVLTVLVGFLAVTMMSGLKYGHQEFSEIAKIIDPSDKNVVVETTDMLWGSFNPIVTYYLPNSQILKDAPADFPKGKKLYFLNFTSTEIAEPNADRGICNNPIWLKQTDSSLYLPVIFGKIIYQMPYGSHFFRPSRFLIDDAAKYTGKEFGIVEVPDPRSGLTIRYCKEG